MPLDVVLAGSSLHVRKDFLASGSLAGVVETLKSLLLPVFPTLAAHIRIDMITVACIALNSFAIIWAGIFYYLSAIWPLLGCFSLIVFGTAAMSISSKKIAVAVLNAGQIICLTFIFSSTGSCQTPMRGYLGSIIVMCFILTQNTSFSLLWVVIVSIVGITIHADMCLDRPGLISSYHIASLDFSYTALVLLLSLLCERERLAVDATKSKFVASVTHELRTPLNGILCAAELLLESDSCNEEELQHVGTVYGCGQLLSSLINNVLDAEMVHTQRRYAGTGRETVFDAVEFCQKAVSSMGYLAQFQNVQCDFKCGTSDPVLVKGDSSRFMQVISNVLNNALKAAPEDTKVVVTLTPRSHSVLFEVEDRGSGIPYSLREKIFKPWVKLTGANVAGVGLGLTICRAAMDEMEGTISCARRKDNQRGSRFKIALPRSTQTSHFSLSGSCEDEEDELQYRMGHSPPAPSETFFRVKNAFHFVKNLIDVAHSVTLQVLTDLNVRVSFLTQRQELVAGSALSVSLIGAVWGVLCTYFEIGSAAGLAVYATLGYLAVALLPIYISRVLGAAITVGIFYTATQMPIGICTNAWRIIHSLVPFIGALFLSQQKLMILTWLLIAVTSVLINFHHDECNIKSYSGDYLFSVMMIAYYVIVFLCCCTYEMQWRVHNGLREQFLKNMSRELRTPLHAVVCAGDLLLERVSWAHVDDFDHVQTIVGCGKLLVSLLNQNLDCGLMTALRKKPLERKQKSFSPNQLCLQMVNIMQHVAKSKKQKEMNICFHYASNVPEDWVEGDSNVLSQVFLNMMSNAVKISPARSTVTVTSHLVKEGSMILFGVEDEGPGVPFDKRESVFRPWVKMTESSVSGAGLGLAISKTIVEGVGGSIGCGERADGKPGARFWFEVPYIVTKLEGSEATQNASLTSCHSEESRSAITGSLDEYENMEERKSSEFRRRKLSREKEDEEDAAMVRWFQNKHILIVEDNTVNEKMLRAMLKTILKQKSPMGKQNTQSKRKERKPHATCDISSTVNGAEAVDYYIAKDGKVDVIFMDLYMPVMDGKKATLLIRKFEEEARHRRSTIVALTASVRESASGPEFDEVLTKPLSRKRLRSMLHWVFEHNTSDKGQGGDG